MEGRTRGIPRTGGGAALRALLALVLAIGLMPAIPATALADEPTAPAVDSWEWVASADMDGGGLAHCASLAEAVNKVGNGGTITLQGDFSGDGVVVESGKNFTLDLNEHTYTIDGETVGSAGTETNGFQLLKDSTITIKDGTIKSDKAKILIQNYSDLTLENVDLVGGTDTQYTLSNNNGNTVIKKGTSITAGQAGGKVAFDVYRFKSYPSASVTIDADAGKITGVIELSAQEGYTGEANSHKLVINGGNLSDAEIKVLDKTEGSFDVEKAPNVVVKAPEGYSWVDGKLTADPGEGGGSTVVAKVGYDGYTTLSDAIAAASNGGTVVLQSDVNDSVNIDEGVTVTIDLSGHTITNTSGSHTITNKGTLTVKDSAGGGVVDNLTHGKGALVNYGTATVEGGKFTRSKEASKSPTDNGGNSWYVIENRGTMTFDGGEVVNDSKLSSLVRNLNGKLTINAGKFENDFIALKNDEGGTLEVKGGVITSDEQSLQNWSVATLSAGTFNGRVATWGYTGTGADGDNTAIGKTTITGTAVVNGDVQAINYMKSKEPPSVTVSGGTVNGDVMKATHVGSGTNLADPDVDTSTIVVTGGSFNASGLNGDSLPYFMEENVVAKSESGLYAVMERSELQAGDYIVAFGAPGITEGDLAEGLEVEYDEATGKWVVSKPAPPVVTKPSYDVAVDQPANGTVELSAKTAKEGQKVIVTVKPDEGFELASLVVADEDGNALKLELSADGTYSFTMPASDVTVHASFADAWENPFTDLGEDHWGYGAVRMANLLGLMKGYDGTTLFGPDDGLMREQAATVMWNLMGDGDVSRPEALQADVDQSQWYAPYVNWAVDSKVMDGYSEDDFGVGDSLTREQFAAVVAKAVGADVDSADQAVLGAFPDADGVSGWARATMAWAVENGVINGAEAEDGTRELQATRELTRAEMATMMVNAIEVGVLDFGA